MILSSLVADDPRSFIDLDKNLGRHIGDQNVAAFHEEAGNLVMDQLVDNPTLFNHLLRDDAVVAELGTAVQRISSKALGKAMPSPTEAQGLARTLIQSASVRDVSLMRDVVKAELLTNAVVNDRTMRNPEIMEILSERVRDLYNKRKVK
jgi:hypothetical protein